MAGQRIVPMACARILPFGFRIKRKTVLLLFLVSTFLYLQSTTLYIATRDLIYLLRPIWGTPPHVPEHLIIHYYAPNISTEKLCSAHGWAPRNSTGNSTKPLRVIDAFIFSIELDMLEIRLRELWQVVDIFVIVEADKTFTGKPKRLFFKENQKRFQWAMEKIKHLVATGLDSHPRKDFTNEVTLRGYVGRFVRGLKPNEGDLIITSDIDEIPYPHTIQLLRSCQGYASEIHLEMRNFLYSFEFPLLTMNWKPHVNIFHPKRFRYHHNKRDSSHRLADAGWHCSFCFRYIYEFVFKMTSYSHSDRVTRKQLTDEKEIQRKICAGADIFDMLPEAYTYQELISQLGNVKKSYSTIGIPQYVVENPDMFRFLLPGGCVRETSNEDAF